MTITLADRLSTRNAFGLIKIAAERKNAELAKKVAVDVTLAEKVAAELAEKVAAELAEKVAAELAEKVAAELAKKVAVELAEKVAAELAEKVADNKRVVHPLFLINELSESKYMIFNVDASKKPINGFTGLLLDNWINLSATELFNGLEISTGAGFGINLGFQGNRNFQGDKTRILSLDFDVCGEKGPDGKRLGCPQTIAFLAEYRAGIDRLHGMYSSSTAGNFNVLVDYTANAEICAMVDAIGKNKFNVAHLEILLRGNQVIPPTATTCKMTGKLGSPRTFLSSEPFYILKNETFMVSFLSNLFEKCKPEPKISKICESVIREPCTVTEDKFLDLLFNVIRNETIGGTKIVSWDHWFKISGILKSNGYSIETFLKYSVPTSTTCEATKLWNDNRRVPPMSIYALQNIAKEINPYGYRDWLNKHNHFLQLETLQRGENHVAKFIAELVRGELIFCDVWWRCEKGLWVGTKAPPLGSLISKIQEQIDLAAENMLFRASKSTDADTTDKCRKCAECFLDFHRKVSGAGYSKQVAAILSQYLADPLFESKLNCAPYTIAYKNGILDLKTLVFRAGIQSEDMISQTLEFDYEAAKSQDVAHIREQIKKICNCNEEHLEYYLSALGYTMTGDSKAHEDLYVIVGQMAANGKSAPIDALTDILPIYVSRAERSAFDKGNTKIHKEIATWNGKRMVWVNEATSAEKDKELLKHISDGSAVSYDKLYGTNTQMPIQFKLWFISNNSMNISADAGIFRRYRHMQMDSKFLSPEEGWTADNYETRVFKKDPNFGSDLRTKYRAAFLHLIFSYSKKFTETGMAAQPADWKAEKEAVMQGNDLFKDWFETKCAVGGDLRVSKQLMEEQLKFVKKVNLRDELKRLRVAFTYDSQERMMVNGVKYKGFYHGFGMIVETEGDPEA